MIHFLNIVLRFVSTFLHYSKSEEILARSILQKCMAFNSFNNPTSLNNLTASFVKPSSTIFLFFCLVSAAGFAQSPIFIGESSFVTISDGNAIYTSVESEIIIVGTSSIYDPSTALTISNINDVINLDFVKKSSLTKPSIAQNNSVIACAKEAKAKIENNFKKLHLPSKHFLYTHTATSRVGISKIFCSLPLVAQEVSLVAATNFKNVSAIRFHTVDVYAQCYHSYFFSRPPPAV